MSDIRIGIVGLGIQGSLYARIIGGTSIPGFSKLRKPEGCVLTAVSTRSVEVLAQIKEQLPSVECFQDWKEMIDSDACDAVVITVPHNLHHEVTIYALQHGKHVLCEKPMDIRVTDVEQMLAEHGKHAELALGLIYNQRVNPLFAQIKKLLDSGELGEIRRSNWIINTWWRPDSYYESNEWRGTWRGEGGGLLVNQASHQLDLWIWLCGAPRKIFAKCLDGMHRNISVENDITLLTEYDNGATGVFVSCAYDPLGTNRLEIDLSKGKIVVENNKTATVYRFKETEDTWNSTLTTKEMETIRRTDETQLYTTEVMGADLVHGGEYSYIFENFAAHIQKGEPLIATEEDGLRAVRLANGARLSGWLHKEVELPCDNREFDRLLQEHIDEELGNK